MTSSPTPAVLPNARALKSRLVHDADCYFEWTDPRCKCVGPPPASDAAVPAGQTFEVDDRGLFCRHCGRSSVRHHRVIGVGNFCDPAAAPKVASDTGAITPEWCLRMAELEVGQEIGAGALDHPLRTKCELPPAGWACMREPGHDGPCAAVASDTDAAASEAGEVWQDIASAPRDGTPFIATLIVHNLSGQRWWETHVIWADDETGEVASECEAGWTRVDDYSHWMPMPAPPAALTTQGGAEG